MPHLVRGPLRVLNIVSVHGSAASPRRRRPGGSHGSLYFFSNSGRCARRYSSNKTSSYCSSPE
ncbi:hypothetical protein NOR_06535 [Metarhizium rileyi]|uniref:Uncharacterized protein n=1 Tax=Metarhizium rileyi (strain RCEF 4871) TaxID=1649241 RepID=A0A167AG86_METRR|nr:hypothetical protein NOR_06535 [Metarhizium rileyi RCEF 4871]